MQADPFSTLRDGIPRLPGEMIDRADQYIAQDAVFTVYAPALEVGSAAAINSGSKPHRGIPSAG
jgi:hypothetical protein